MRPTSGSKRRLGIVITRIVYERLHLFIPVKAQDARPVAPILLFRPLQAPQPKSRREIRVLSQLTAPLSSLLPPPSPRSPARPSTQPYTP